MKKLSRSKRRSLATLIAALIALFSALEFIDFDKLDWTSFNTYIKLGLIVLIFLGGLFSEVSPAKKPIIDELS